MKRAWSAGWIVLALAARASPEATSARVDAFVSAVRNGAPQAEATLWSQLAREGTPIVEGSPGHPGDSLVSFVWRSPRHPDNVVVITPHSLLDIRAGAMKRVQGTHTWTVTMSMRNDARLLYRFAEDDSLVPFESDPDVFKRMATWMRDTLNPRTYPLPGGAQASVLDLPALRGEDRPRSAEVRRGSIRTIAFSDAGLARTGWVYTPAGDAGGAGRPAVIFLDGEEYRDDMQAPAILDAEIAAGRLPPLVAVFLSTDPESREKDFDCNRAWSDFLSTTVVPVLRRDFNASEAPGRTVVAGFSLGGLAAACAALQHPDVFGAVLAQSGSFYRAAGSDEPERVAREVASGPARAIRWHLDIGLLERAAIPSRDPSMLTATRHLRDVLSARGSSVHYVEFYGGHEHVAWRALIADALHTLLLNP